MKVSIFCLAVLAFGLQSVSAACECDARDTECLAKCVSGTNSCIAACNGEINCYENCISDGWPGVTTSANSATITQSGSNSVPTVSTTSISSAIPTQPSQISVGPSETLVSLAPSGVSSSAQLSSANPSAISSAISSASSSLTASESTQETTGSNSATGLVPALGFTLLSAGLAVLGFA